MTDEQFRESESTHQGRHQGDAAREVPIAEVETLEGIDRLLSDAGDEEADESRRSSPSAGRCQSAFPDMTTPKMASQKNS